MACCQSGDKPLSLPLMVRLPTHICITHPRWVKKCDPQHEWSYCSATALFYAMFLCCVKIFSSYLPFHLEKIILAIWTGFYVFFNFSFDLWTTHYMLSKFSLFCISFIMFILTGIYLPISFFVNFNKSMFFPQTESSFGIYVNIEVYVK